MPLDNFCVRLGWRVKLKGDSRALLGILSTYLGIHTYMGIQTRVFKLHIARDDT